MRKKISVIGKGVQIAGGLAELAEVADDVRGADVVVLAEDGDLAAIARSAPAATIVITGDGLEERCKQAYEQLLYPRGRIVGVPEAGGVSDAVASILFERDEAHDVVAMRDGAFVPCSATLGRGGITEFIPPRTSLPAS
jgi:hypothetical protein